MYLTLFRAYVYKHSRRSYVVLDLVAAAVTTGAASLAAIALGAVLGEMSVSVAVEADDVLVGALAANVALLTAVEATLVTFALTLALATTAVGRAGATVVIAVVACCIF